ncbi:MAG: serine/threonine-protein kinase [Acidobacteriota bacterium]
MGTEPDSAARIRELFDAAWALAPGDRAAFLDEACAPDRALAARVRNLLEAADATRGFMETEDPAPRERFGPYRTIERLGRGGMGVVYRARHDASGREVALKTVALPDATLLGAMRREIEALAEIRHPGIVTILEVGVDEGTPWYAMELHEGKTLHAHARSERDAGSIVDLLTIVRRICPALAYLHGEGMLHLDLKPANILVRPDGRPLLIDFGLAVPLSGGRAREALTTHALLQGTAAYMAPEQTAGESLDARTDLYALGCILFELLTGSVPFASPSRIEMMERRRIEDPPPPSALRAGLPAVLDRLLLGLLARPAGGSDRACRCGRRRARPGGGLDRPRGSGGAPTEALPLPPGARGTRRRAAIAL